MRIHLVLGLTGVGKTERSVALARSRGAPVVSLDRFQIFDDLATGTGRPSDEELAGTERIYLTRRSVAEGELSAPEAYEVLLRLISAWSWRDMILEGGSISLCALLFERGLLDAYPHEIEYLSVSDWGRYAARVRRRIGVMMMSRGGRRSIAEELARVWNHPAQLAFVETITGYDALARYCRGVGVAPGELAGRVSDPQLLDALTEAHVEYARRQHALFDQLLGTRRASAPRDSSTQRREEEASSAGPMEFDLQAPAQLDDPYAVYARLRREAPVFYSASVDAWAVSRYEDIATILKDPARFSSAGVLKVRREPPAEVRAILAKGIPYVRTLLDNDPPDHTRFRNLVNKAFIPRRVQALEPLVYATADALIDEFIADGGADLMERFAYPLPIHVIAGILGLPRADARHLKRWSDDWMALQSGTAPVERLVDCAHNYLFMQQYFQEKVDERTRAPEDDLISALIQARVDGEAPLGRDELVRLLMSLLVAGHETTTHAIGNTLMLLLSHPAQFAQLCADPGLAPQAFEEGLRMDPPVQSLFRRVMVDSEIAGVKVPAGARVMVLYGSANRDESQFDDPDCFDIRRPEAGKHMAFSRGVHFCLGAPMARLEGRIALERLSQRLPGLRRDEALSLERVEHFFLRGYKRFPIMWDPPHTIHREHEMAPLRPTGGNRL
jgi:cytochrome P450